jgi:hypothetical protein
MWAIRILNGPQAGQIFPLRPGKNNIGRGLACEVKINSGSVSKEHACVLVTEDKLILTDLNSRNGTFVNGVRIQNQRVATGDKFALHDILFDVVQVPAGFGASQSLATPSTMPAWAGNAAARMQYPAPPMYPQTPYGVPHAGPDLMADGAHPSSAQPMSAGSLSDIFRNFKIYIDNVAMPGVYTLVQQVQFRWALAALVGVYVIMVTALSVVPMMSVTKSAIQTESLRRAKTIARNLAAVNREAIIQKNDLAVSTRTADIEEGVYAAYLISARDGTVIAPASKRGEYVNRPFVNDAWRKDQESESIIDSSSLGVSIPIAYFNAETGNQSVAAFAVVLYDMGAQAMSSIQGFALFIQILAMSLLFGAALFFFLIKIVEEPLVVLNTGLDDALREGRDDLQTKYRFPALENLVSKINSALSRIGQPTSQMAAGPIVNRDIEASNIVRMLPTAAIAVNAIDDRVISTNAEFDQLVGGGVALQGRSLTDIPDMALQANLVELLPRMRASHGEIALSEIPFPGAKYEICGQAVMGSTEPAYFLVTLNKQGGD